MVKSMTKGKFQPPQIQDRLIDFEKNRTLELSRKTTHHAKFHFDPTMRVLSANTQFATVTEKTISGVHVSPGSGKTLVRIGGI